jgi:hypothetical protein
MKSYMERVIAEIPQFMTHFSQCLFRPRRFLHEQLALDARADQISKGVEFLTLSFLIALFVSQVLPEAVNPMTLPADDSAFVQMASEALFGLFMLFFSAAIAFGCLRLVGVSGSFFAFFRVFAFFCGVSLVLMVFANALTNIIFIDPVVAKSWIKLEQMGAQMQAMTAQMFCNTDDAGEVAKDPALGKKWQEQLSAGAAIYGKATARPLFILGSGLQALVYTLMVVWVLAVWFAYGQHYGLSGARIFGSAVLSLALISGASLLLSTIQTGSQMMKQYRACAAMEAVTGHDIPAATP